MQSVKMHAKLLGDSIPSPGFYMRVLTSLMCIIHGLRCRLRQRLNRYLTTKIFCFPLLQLSSEVAQSDLFILLSRVEHQVLCYAGGLSDSIGYLLAVLHLVAVDHCEDAVGPVLVCWPQIAVAHCVESSHL